MECRDVRTWIVDYQRGRLAPGREEDVRAHLAECPPCSRAEAAERALTELLERRLPQHPAPVHLKLSLAALWPPAAEPTPSWWERWGRSVVPAGAVALVLLAAVPAYYGRLATRQSAAPGGMVTETVNDHLRILQSGHPLEIESGNFHQVKPWFAGRLDFAPSVPFLGDAEFPLRGGSLAWFLDRRAAAFVYGYRLHTITALVFRAEGLPWPDRDLQALGSARIYEATARGFTVILWRAGGLGYAVVSDVEPAQLRRLAAKLSGGA